MKTVGKQQFIAVALWRLVRNGSIGKAIAENVLEYLGVDERWQQEEQ
jgi:hypothetical protein